MDIFLKPCLVLLVIATTILETTSGRYHDEEAQQPGPSILVHKQALNDDGSFNFVFAADNGLRQGERILPDGTRVGAYSYVDPNGETISVKYKAGKDGFKILEGAHIPTPPALGLTDDPAEAPTEILLPTPVVRTTPSPPPPPPKIRRERIKKETSTPFKRPTMKIPKTPKRIRTRGTKGPLVMVHRMPNESEHRVASFHIEQPTFRGQLSKAESQDHPHREAKPDLFGSKDNPKAYSFQFGSAR